MTPDKALLEAMAWATLAGTEIGRHAHAEELIDRIVVALREATMAERARAAEIARARGRDYDAIERNGDGDNSIFRAASNAANNIATAIEKEPD